MMYDVRMKLKLEKMDCKYGAPLGRPNIIPADIKTVGKLSIRKLRWVDGDYDEKCAYWGNTGKDNIYRAIGETATADVEIFVRATSREEAKEKIQDMIDNPDVLFRFFSPSIISLDSSH